MITDRTARDYELAKTLRLKLQSDLPLTAAEIEQIERGSCTHVMINRVESKTGELADILNEYLYQNNIITKTDWEEYDPETGTGDIFDRDNYNRLLNNLDLLKQAFFVYSTTPTTPQYMYGYKEANNIEKILVDIENMIADMVQSFRICGAFNCGE